MARGIAHSPLTTIHLSEMDLVALRTDGNQNRSTYAAIVNSLPTEPVFPD